MARALIEVAQQDIDGSDRKSTEFNPISIAIRRQIGPNLWVPNANCGALLIAIEGPSRQGRNICDLPVECTEFLDAFYDGLEVSPFVFVFEFRIHQLLGRAA